MSVIFPILLMLLYSAAIVAVVIYLLVLATRFVKAHERIAVELQTIADRRQIIPD